MKKIISFVLALALACSFSSTAFAASVTEESDQKNGYTEIVYNLDTGYCIEIPKTIDAAAGAYTFSASYVNLSASEQVVVKMSDVNEYSCLSLKNEAGDALQCCVMYDHATITPNYIVAVFTDSVTADGAMEINPDISGSAHRTGRYSGIFEFTVSVEPRG